MLIHFFRDMTKITSFYRMYNENYSVLENKMLQHSHDPKDVYLSNDNTYFILSIRNMMETIISKRIAQQIGKWVHYGQRIEVMPFYFTLGDYIQMYVDLKKYYIDILTLMPAKTKIINYEDFKDNIYNLFNIFDVPKNRLLRYNYRYPIITKTPGSHKDWILNYDEITEFNEHLEQDPLAIMGKGSNAPPSFISV